MISPLTLTDPFSTVWYHGTKSKQFTDWQCPPPVPGPADVPHSALFFTAHKTYAEAAGQMVCVASLVPNTRIITPALGGIQSSELRKNLIKSRSIAAYCEWLVDDRTWINAWSTGEIMRFAYDALNQKAVLDIATALTQVAANLKKMIATPVSDELIMDQSMMCLTRGWIEKIVEEARKLGFQAIHGAEIDRWGNPSATPVAQSWLAVLDKSAVSAPKWV